MIRKLTILDENFITVESSATMALQKAATAMNDISTSLAGILHHDGSAGDIRFFPEYIEIRAKVNPVEKSATQVQKIIEAIQNPKRTFSYDQAAMLSVIYSQLSKNINIVDNGADASAQIVEIFNSPASDISYNSDEGTVVIGPTASQVYRTHLSEMRELASSLPAKLSDAVSANNSQAVYDAMQKILLLNEFVMNL